MEEDAPNHSERESGSTRREGDEWAVLPGGEEKDEEMGMENDDGVLDGAPNAGDDDDDNGGGVSDEDDDGGGGESGAAKRVITVEECLKDDFPLLYACKGGASLDVITYLVEEADDDKELISKGDIYRWYPLHRALQGGASLEVIKYLVEEADGDKGKELLSKEVCSDFCSGWWYPLHVACTGGVSLDVIKYLVEEADGDNGKTMLGEADGAGVYPLHLALQGGASLDVIKYLAEEADGEKGKELLGKKDDNGWYPLHLACEGGGASVDVIKYLVEEADGDNGKDLLSKKDDNGWYPLHLACKGGASLDVIKYLVEEADGDKGKELLNKVDQDGNCPLHVACKGGASVDVIKYLAEEADGDKGKELLSKKDDKGWYPLHLACWFAASLDVIKYLVEEADGDKGKDLLSKKDDKGWYPLHLACKGGASLEVITYLVEEADGDKGKDPLSKKDDKGWYPLHCACKGGASLDVIKYLVEEADGDKGKELLSKKDDNGWYPLHLACDGGASLDVIKYLVEEADGDKGKELLSEVDEYGYPLHLVSEKHASVDVIKYLVEEACGEKEEVQHVVISVNNQFRSRRRRGLLSLPTYDDDSGGASGAANMITVDDCLKQVYPLHWACKGGASLDVILDVIKYLVEEVDGDKGKELLGKKDQKDNNPLHLACRFGASLDVIKYLVEEADGDKGKDLLSKKDDNGWYPLHLACKGGTSLEVIIYLVEEADGDKGKDLLSKVDKFGMYPLHLACRFAASLDVIKYLVEEVDGDKGKDLLSRVDKFVMYPLHLACKGGASLDVIKYLVEEADGDKGKDPLSKKDDDGWYPLHLACKGGASLEVIIYLVEEADGDNGKDLLNKKDDNGWYPLHLACKGGASIEVIKYLIQKNPVPLQHKDRNGLNCLDSMNSDILRAIWGRTHQIGTVADKSSDIDRLNYLLYARALVYAARQAEQPGTSLCVGLYARWGGGKSTLWKQIKKCLEAEFLQEDALLLYNVYQLSGQSLHPLYRKAAENAKKPFNIAVERLASDPYVLNDAKKAWREKSEGAPPTTSLTFLEHLAWLFLRILCACQSCRKGYELESDPRNANDVHIQRTQIKSQDARSRRMEWTDYRYHVMLEEREENDSDDCNDEKIDDNIKKEAEQIAGIITGDVPLGDGDSAHWDVAPCGTIFVIILLQIVRAIVSGISRACAALHHVMYFQWWRSKTNHTPTGAVKYKIVEFNAWTYQGSELLWASLMKDLWDAVEAEFGEKVVRYHRAGIALAEENQFDESHRSLSPQEKARNRKRALLMFRARSYLYLFLFLIVLTVLLTLTIINCKSINRTCLGKLKNATNNATDTIEAVESDSEGKGVIAAIIATVAAFCPLLANGIKYWNKVRPYMRKARGDFILEKASGSTKRKDFKAELGFMGEIKTEVEYLFDLLNTETYLDKEIGCNRSLRLCVFIDDLDRCPQEAVVSVLEAVILLLVDGPISVWMAIDSRIVVQCIEAVKVGLFDKANISGHEFLDKIVQLPFTLPELTNDTKKSYLDKIIDEKELDPARVLSRFLKEGLDRKLQIGVNEEAYQNEDPFLPLTRIATELDEDGYILSRHNSKAVIGMTESDLIKTVAKNPQNVSAEHQENLCFIISQAIQGDDQETLPDSKENSHTVPVPEASDDIVHIMGPPPSGLYIPMLNESDRRCLEDFMPFIDGNPRRMKRIINVFNLSRRIAKLRCEVSPQLTAKILKMVILVEQWPYRMAWLLQLIEDVNQMSSHSLEVTRMNQFLGECFRRDEVRPDELCWDMICRVGILEVYRRVVCELSMSNVDSSNMGSIDSDPQLFEGLLLCNGNDRLSPSEGPYAITVHDLRPLGCNNSESCLRRYMFNIPHAVTDKVSIMMSKALHQHLFVRRSESSDEGEEDGDVVNGSDDSSESSGSGGNSGGGSVDFSSGYESDDTDDGNEGGKSQNSSKTPVRGHTYETQKQEASKTASKKRISGKGNNKTMKTRAGKKRAPTGPTTDQRTDMEKEMYKKLDHAEAFKRMSDALGNRVQAALQCPELFKAFLTPEERIALEAEQLV
eukprot:scaffold10195_cov70-Skeletonema_dohrnii-CCMP3373.AAC.3